MWVLEDFFFNSTCCSGSMQKLCCPWVLSCIKQISLLLTSWWRGTRWGCTWQSILGKSCAACVACFLHSLEFMLGELDELVSLSSSKRVKDILSQCILIELPFRVGWFISMVWITNSATVLIYFSYIHTDDISSVLWSLQVSQSLYKVQDKNKNIKACFFVHYIVSV